MKQRKKNGKKINQHSYNSYNLIQGIFVIIEFGLLRMGNDSFLSEYKNKISASSILHMMAEQTDLRKKIEKYFFFLIIFQATT